MRMLCLYCRPWSRGKGWGCSIGSNRRTQSISELSMIVADKTRGFHRAKLVIIDPGLYVDVFWIPQRRSFPTSFMLFTVYCHNKIFKVVLRVYSLEKLSPWTMMTMANTFVILVLSTVHCWQTIFSHQVFPGSWTAVRGLSNLLVENPDSWYLGQELYISVVNLEEDRSNKMVLHLPNNMISFLRRALEPTEV